MNYLCSLNSPTVAMFLYLYKISEGKTIEINYEAISHLVSWKYWQWQVRIKTRQNKVELDLRVDSSSTTFNEDANEQLKKTIQVIFLVLEESQKLSFSPIPYNLSDTLQTLSSNRGTVDENYSIGILRGNQVESH